MKRITYFAIVILLVVGGSWFAWDRFANNRSENGEERRPTAEVQKRTLAFDLQLTGDLAPAVSVDVKSEVGGRIKALHAVTGASVVRGDLLLEIDDTDLLNEKEGVLTEVEGARLNLEKTRRNFERSAVLHEGNLITKEVFDNLEADLAIAKNQLARSERQLQSVRDRLSKLQIHAPMSGTILNIPVVEGQVVSPAASVSDGTLLMVIADLDRLVVNSHINQIDVANIEPGHRVKIGMDAIPEVDMEAEISFVAPVATVSSNIKGFNIRAILENPHPRLRPGMTVTMTVPVAHVEDAVAVPISAIFEQRDGRKVVYIRNSTGAVSERDVQVGITDLFYAEILDGLEFGEIVYLVEPEMIGDAS